GEGDLVDEHHPVRPLFHRAAEEIADGLLVLKSIASVNVLDTGDGLVMLDTGGLFDADHVFDEVRRWRPRARVAAAVYSHHHIDHVFGTLRFDPEAREGGWPAPRVYAHDAVAGNFRRYERTLGWNTAINQRQFGIPIEAWTFPDRFRDPDVTFAERLTFRQ